MVQGGEVFKVGSGSRSCEAVVQAEDWLSWVEDKMRYDFRTRATAAEEDVEHLLVMCGEFEGGWWVLADVVSRIVGVGEWLGEYGRVCKEG